MEGPYNDVDSILEKIRSNCILLSQAHKERYIELNNMLKYYKIPVIIISGISSLVSVGQQFIPQLVITICNGLFGLSCSIIVSIELYLGISQQLAQSASLTKEFYTLSTNIFKTLALSSENRTENTLTYLESVYGEYSSLCANSYIVLTTINDSLIPLPENIHHAERHSSIIFSLLSPRRSTANFSSNQTETSTTAPTPPTTPITPYKNKNMILTGPRQSMFGFFPQTSSRDDTPIYNEIQQQEQANARSTIINDISNTVPIF